MIINPGTESGDAIEEKERSRASEERVLRRFSKGKEGVDKLITVDGNNVINNG